MNMPAQVSNSFVRNVVAPSIVHFIGPTKPWDGPRFGMKHPARPEIEDFLLRSPWASYLSSRRPLYGAPPKPELFELPTYVSRDEIAAYLRDTEFADVIQGITRLDLSAIPDNLVVTPAKPA